MFREDGSYLGRRELRAGISTWETSGGGGGAMTAQMRGICGVVFPQACSLGKATRASHSATLHGAPALGPAACAKEEVMSGI